VGSFSLINYFLRAPIHMGLNSGCGGNVMRSAWNHCALDALNFLQNGVVGCGSFSDGLGKRKA
jgi:hypothetical protein